MKKRAGISPKILIILLFCSCTAFSQSPFFSIKFNVSSPPGEQILSKSYQIIDKTCSFNYKPEIISGDYWFGKDTSKLDWESLPDSMYSKLECGKENITDGAKYENSDQDMIWEKIYCFKIIETGNQKKSPDTMTIVFPVLIKSFVTLINLGGIQFSPGYFELTNVLLYKTGSDSYLHISLPEAHTWKSVKFEERKIKF